MVDALFNFGGKEKKLFCKNCKKITEHVSVTRPDEAKMYKYKHQTAARIIGTILDLFPGYQLLWGVPYVCTKCHHLRSHCALMGDEL